jgi:2-succinyl-6-hydroxy-2,4-cyclohexadiene-1-carboxylate synthase
MYNWHYNLVGDRSLPPLVLLHGWMGSSEDYAEVIELLKSQFYCIAIDLPGHGQTEVIGDDLGYNFIETATGIIQLLDRLKIDRTSIFGYSFGSRLALYLVLEFPDRFVGAASGYEHRVILESTSAGLPTVAERDARIISDDRIIRQLATNNFPDFVTNWYRQPIFTGIEEHPNFPTLIQRRLKNQPDRLAKSLKYAGLGRQPYLLNRLKTHDRPILLIVGERDRKFRLIAQTLDRNCACISLKIISDCSHNIHFQSPRSWIELFDILAFEHPGYVRHARI